MITRKKHCWHTKIIEGKVGKDIKTFCCFCNTNRFINGKLVSRSHGPYIREDITDQKIDLLDYPCDKRI